LLTIKVAFATFKKGLDPDIVVYPVMSTVADIFITICYVAVLNLFFFSDLGKSTIVIIGLSHLLAVFYIFPKNRRESEFIKTIKESLVTIMFVAVIVNITGTILKGISNFVENRLEIYTVYPALIDMLGDVGSTVGSTATTKLALGLLKPSLSSIRHHARNIFSAWAASIILFVVLAVLSLSINGLLSFSALFRLLFVLLIANIIGVATIVIVSYRISILTFKKGLDPDNFVIPIESSFADSTMSIALLAALFLVG
jgi:mgtE-like transporter